MRDVITVTVEAQLSAYGQVMLKHKIEKALDELMQKDGFSRASSGVGGAVFYIKYVRRGQNGE